MKSFRFIPPDVTDEMRAGFSAAFVVLEQINVSAADDDPTELTEAQRRALATILTIADTAVLATRLAWTVGDIVRIRRFVDRATTDAPQTKPVYGLVGVPQCPDCSSFLIISYSSVADDTARAFVGQYSPTTIYEHTRCVVCSFEGKRVAEHRP